MKRVVSHQLEPDTIKHPRLSMKRSTPDTPDVPEPDVLNRKRQRLDLSALQRKRIPLHTLIAAAKDGTTIVALAVPTKQGQYIKFGISDDGMASRKNTTSEQDFTESYDMVVRTQKPVTLSNGMVDPAKLSDNVVIVKAPPKQEPSKEEEEELPSKEEEELSDYEDSENDEPLKEETPNPPQLTLDVEDVPKPDQMEIESVPQEQANIKENIEKAIVEQSDVGSTLVVYDKPNEALTELGVLRDYSKLLVTEMRKEVDIDKRKIQVQELRSVLQTISAMETQDSMPTRVTKVEIEDALQNDLEKEEIKEVVVKKQQQLAIAKESPENKLSKGQVASVEPTEIVSGAHLDIEMEDQVDQTEADAADPAKQDAKDVNDIPPIVDIDVEMSDVNQKTDRTTLGSDRHVDVLEQHRSQVSSIAASANAIETVVSGMEVISPAEVRREQKEFRKQQQAERISARKDAAAQQKAFNAQQKAEAAQMKIENQMDVSDTVPTDEEVNAKLKREMQTLFEASQAPRLKAEEKARAEFHALNEAGVLIPGVMGIMTDLQSRGLIEDTEDPAMIRKVVASLRKNNKVMDVRTAAPPTEEDLIQSTIKQGQLGIPGVMGSSGVGSPIFVPSTARDDLQSLMSGVITITENESLQLKAEMTPLWNEFKLGRLAAGVREMERMPSRLITDPKSSIKNASKIREDELQQNITFGNFISWLLHDRLDNTKMSTWRGMLLYSAALGYNDLTQSQINWIITGNENGDLDSNTDFYRLSEEEGDPLDQQLEIKGRMIKMSMVKSLSAQLDGNPKPSTPYPSKNTSPSAAPIDDSIHPDNSTGPQRANRSTFKGLPVSISNIPDPRFSKRGHENVANVRIATIKNPEFDPTKSPDDPDYQPEFTTTPIDDLGAGSKEIGAHIEAAVSDRLLRSMPSKLYAPIHAQACDRYLGSINYQRLSMTLEKYMKSYSQHPWGPQDFQQMFEWNSYTMALYGTMLYAFVTDIKMQRITPFFDMSTPIAVGDEYMELNELISELARYQQASEDRAGRVGDDGSGKRPVEEHIDQYLKEQSDRDNMLLQESNVVAISVPTTPFPTQQAQPTPPPPPTTTPVQSDNPFSPSALASATPPVQSTNPFAASSFMRSAPLLSTNTTIQSGIDTGITRNPTGIQGDDFDRRNQMFRMLG